MAEKIKIGKISDFKENVGKLVKVGKKEIAVFKINGNFYAIDELCTHEGGPLHEGYVEDTTIVCPWHGAQFDLKTGKILRPPASEDINTYKVIIKDEEVYIEL
ncbi:MAG: non-heme iron oxygenase ferredoxin subunit [Candidatus Aenigmatarchaeota archaeon]